MAPSPSGCCLGRFMIMHHDFFKPTNPLRTNYKFGNEALVTRPRPFCCDLRFLPSDAYIPLDTVLQVLHLPFLCSWTILLRNNIFNSSLSKWWGHICTSDIVPYRESQQVSTNLSYKRRDRYIFIFLLEDDSPFGTRGPSLGQP